MQQSELERAEIDLRRRETEAGWQQVLDSFWLNATPKIFEWLEWILVISAFQFVASQTRQPVARLVPAACGVMLLFYFNAFFFRMSFKGLPGVRSSGAERLISLVVSALLAMVCWYGATLIAKAVADHTK